MNNKTSCDFQTILVVEDELPLLFAIGDKLTREGYRVLFAHNGEEGLKVACKERPDIILIDIIMPKMNGFILKKKLRSKGAWGKQVHIIFLTNVSPNEMQKMNTFSAEDLDYYLIKSNWTMNSLVEKVRETLKQNT